MALETKAELQPETVETLQELIQVNIDSRDGFQHAAQVTEDLNLSTLFQSLAQQREEQANQLSRYVEWNQQQPNRSGSYAAALHRSWMMVREAVSSNNAFAILAEAERGEDLIKSAYEAALRRTAGSAVNDVLMQQCAKVIAAHDRIRSLRDEYQTQPPR